MNSFLKNHARYFLLIFGIHLLIGSGCHKHSNYTESKATHQQWQREDNGSALMIPPPIMEEQEILIPTNAIMDEADSWGDDEGGSEGEAFNTEEYNRIYENPFLSPQQDPLSTFSIDVDVASYANVRRFINDNQMPYPDAVRIEELINYFNYDYPQPQGKHPFSITTEASACPWNDEHNLVMIGLKGKEIATENLPPSNLVFLLDVSGSMNTPDKLPLLKSAFRLLVNELGENDRVSIVVYAGAAGVVLPSTSAINNSEILAAIERLEAGGSTAGGKGIELAYRIAGENFIEGGNNRVILATDGDFNIGPSSEGELVRMIEEKRENGCLFICFRIWVRQYQRCKNGTASR